ncbi:MAG: hypothetical protein AAFY52_09920 [Pseudomonadota bacterium]
MQGLDWLGFALDDALNVASAARAAEAGSKPILIVTASSLASSKLMKSGVWMRAPCSTARNRSDTDATYGETIAMRRSPRCSHAAIRADTGSLTWRAGVPARICSAMTFAPICAVPEVQP